MINLCGRSEMPWFRPLAPDPNRIQSDVHRSSMTRYSLADQRFVVTRALLASAPCRVRRVGGGWTGAKRARWQGFSVVELAGIIEEDAELLTKWSFRCRIMFWLWFWSACRSNASC